jgi:flagellar export protein FliJ
MADPVARLLRLRAIEADAARRAVAAALRAQGEAEARLAVAQHAISAEARIGVADAADPLAGAFARWLPAGQAAIRRAAMEEAAKRAALEVARGALTAARVSVRACETLQETQAALRREAVLKAEQLAIEESGRRT